MAEKITHNGVSGLFIPDQEWDRFKKDLEKQNQRIHDLEKEVIRVVELEREVEIARGESKYKLKKLARIIERKDKQIDELNKKLES